MKITKSYIEGLKQRVKLVKLAHDNILDIDYYEREFHVRNLLDYLETIENFAEEEKLTCCGEVGCKHTHCQTCAGCYIGDWREERGGETRHRH